MEDPTSTRLADLLSALRRSVRFPGRVRVLGDAALASTIVQVADEVEWVGIGTAMVLGAACGTALSEASRGGEVLVVGGADALHTQDELRTALGLCNLSVVALTGADAAIAPSDRARSLLGQDGGITCALAAISPPGAAGMQPAETWLRRREWPPVQLACLGRSGHCPWPQAAAAPLAAQLLTACRFVAQREPALLVAQDETPWRSVAVTPGTVMALAQIASAGRRVVVSITPAILAQCVAELAVAGRRGLALKLLCPWPAEGAAAILPDLGPDGPLGRWWVHASADPAEAEAILVQTLMHEDPALLLHAELPRAAAPQLLGYPRSQPWTMGSGREVAAGDQALVLCSGAQTPAALALRTRLQGQGISVALWQCTSLAPLPVVALRSLIALWRQTHGAGTLLCLDPDGGALARALATEVTDAVPVASTISAAERMLGDGARAMR